MKKSVATKAYQRNIVKAAKSIDRKKGIKLAMSTFLLLVLISEGLKLAMQAW